MPALPSPGKVIKMTIGYTDGSDTNIQNHHYFAFSGSIGGTDAGTLAGSFQSKWISSMAPMVTTNYILTSVTVTDLSSSTGVEVVNTYNNAGSNAGTKLPSGTAAVLSAKIARRYRGGHPRVYLGGFPETDLATANTWTTGFLGSLFTNYTACLSQVITSPPPTVGTMSEVSVSFYSGFKVITNPVTGRSRNVVTPRTTPLVDTISSYSTNARVASQRRRNKQSA